MSKSNEERIRESKRIRNKYPDKIPIIFICNPEIDKILKKRKYLCPRNITASDFISVVKSKMEISDSKKALILFTHNTIVCGNTLMGFIDDERKNKDDMLIMTLQFENTFGIGNS